ncbi:MAG: amino acid carrier protein [Rhabdochlamydiaceae bacterium]|nr:amino acid carrier protein [Rhabdochlamydiaceae bacterium]
MLSSFFRFLSDADQFFWSYIAFVLIMVFGVFLTAKMRFFQIRSLPIAVKTFVEFMKMKGSESQGVHPIKVFFASVGGMIGIGNVVGIATAVQIGGPGALFWVWVAGLIGAMIKYSEILLGLKYRVRNDQGGYDGGPVYFLRAAFKNRWISIVVAVLLCIYGVEIYQFTVVTESLSANLPINRYLLMAVFLAMILYAGIGGVRRIGKICSLVMPFFLAGYLLMGLWLIGREAHLLPGIFADVFRSAFMGHAAVGGFVGSSLILTIQHGIARAAYSADLGIGYDSIIQSESNTVYPQKQARLAILGVFIDNLICSISILIVLVSGVWAVSPSIEGSALMQVALGKYFPSMNLFVPLFLLIVGYTTIIAFFCVGMKCARFLSPKFGEKIYILYAVASFIFFSFFDQTKALLIMSISGALLLSINLLGMFRLRKEIMDPGGAPEEPAVTEVIPTL